MHFNFQFHFSCICVLYHSPNYGIIAISSIYEIMSYLLDIGHITHWLSFYKIMYASDIVWQKLWIHSLVGCATEKKPYACTTSLQFFVPLQKLENGLLDIRSLESKTWIRAHRALSEADRLLACSEHDEDLLPLQFAFGSVKSPDCLTLASWHGYLGFPGWPTQLQGKNKGLKILEIWPKILFW